MKCMDIYNYTSDPLSNDKTILELADIYMNAYSGHNGFYNELVTPKRLKGQKFYINSADYQKFYVDAYNKWKNNICKLTREQFIELFNDRKVGNDFINLRNYLLKQPPFKTAEECMSFMNSHHDISGLDDLIEKYSWESRGLFSGWIHVHSNDFYGNKPDHFPILHRLYLNLESQNVYKMASILQEEFEKRKMSFYFKFTRYDIRQDTLVLYGSSEMIPRYIEVLNDIKNKYPNVVKMHDTPPLLTAKVNGWIGYGSEPKKDESGNHSFNEIRSKIINKSFDSYIGNYIYNNRNRIINYSGRVMNLYEYLSIIFTDKILSDLYDRYDRLYRYYSDEAKRKKIPFDVNTVENHTKYKRSEIDLPSNRKKIETEIRKALPQLIFADINNKGFKYNIKLNDKYTISINKSSAIDLYKKFVPALKALNPNFVTEIRETIKRNSKEYGIDLNNFAFDTSSLMDFKRCDDMINQKKSPQQGQTTSKKTIDYTKITANNICSIIDPNLINKLVVLSDGSKITAKDYITKIVFPYLPDTGLVVLKNNQMISVKDFIEKIVLRSGQTLFKGDIEKIMTGFTKGNPGLLTIYKNGQKHKIMANEIIKYIKPSLLNQMLVTPDGSYLSASSYLKKYIIPQLSYYGTSYLISGKEVLTLDYLESVLLWSKKHPGANLKQIFFRATRSNLGTINITNTKYLNKTQLNKNNSEFRRRN